MTDENLRTLARAHGGHPVGLYIWEGANHEIYIGISEDSVTKRLRSHLKNYDFANIQSFRFLEHHGSKSELRDIERQLIWEAIWADLTVFNSEHASSIFGDSEFDETIPVDGQLAWFNDPATTNLRADHTFHDVDKREHARSMKKYPKFVRRTDADQIIDAISLYLRACTPYPFQTQVGYWGVSCLPGSHIGPGYKRLSTVNMGVLEMLWITQTPSGETTVKMGTDYQFLPPGDTAAELRNIDVEMAGIVHPKGGANEEVLMFPSIKTFVHALQHSSPIRIAAARFALDRMRMGKLTRHRDAHNYLLAEEALRRIDKWDIPSEPLDALPDMARPL